MDISCSYDMSYVITFDICHYIAVYLLSLSLATFRTKLSASCFELSRYVSLVNTALYVCGESQKKHNLSSGKVASSVFQSKSWQMSSFFSPSVLNDGPVTNECYCSADCNWTSEVVDVDKAMMAFEFIANCFRYFSAPFATDSGGMSKNDVLAIAITVSCILSNDRDIFGWANLGLNNINVYIDPPVLILRMTHN